MSSSQHCLSPTGVWNTASYWLPDSPNMPQITLDGPVQAHRTQRIVYVLFMTPQGSLKLWYHYQRKSTNGGAEFEKADFQLCLLVSVVVMCVCTDLCFRGPQDTCFEGGVFPAVLSFPSDYPLSPPKMRFTCDMFHPNSKSAPRFSRHMSSKPFITKLCFESGRTAMPLHIAVHLSHLQYNADFSGLYIYTFILQTPQSIACFCSL